MLGEKRGLRRAQRSWRITEDGDASHYLHHIVDFAPAYFLLIAI